MAENEEYYYNEDDNIEDHLDEKITIEDDLVADTPEILTILKRYCEDKRIYLCEYLMFEDIYYFVNE